MPQFLSFQISVLFYWYETVQKKVYSTIVMYPCNYVYLIFLHMLKNPSMHTPQRKAKLLFFHSMLNQNVHIINIYIWKMSAMKWVFDLVVNCVGYVSLPPVKLLRKKITTICKYTNDVFLSHHVWKMKK